MPSAVLVQWKPFKLFSNEVTFDINGQVIITIPEFRYQGIFMMLPTWMLMQTNNARPHQLDLSFPPVMWSPWSLDLTPSGLFFLEKIHDFWWLRGRIITAVVTLMPNKLRLVWIETDYHLEVWWVTYGAHT